MKRKYWKKAIAIILLISILPWSYYANALSVSAKGNNMAVEESFHVSHEVDEEEEQTLDTESISDNGFTKDVKDKIDETVVKSGINQEKIMNSGEMQGLVMSNYVLESDMVIDGDLVLTTGKLDINGHTLMVHGDVIQGDATILLNGGQMLVDKDFRMQTRENIVGEENQIPSYNYTSCKAILNMVQESDYLLVNGNMYIQTEISHSGKLTAGVMEIKGNFSQINATTTRNFCASGNHCLLLSGETQQTVKFESNKLSGSKIMNLEIKNQSEDGVVFANRPYVAGIVKDGAVKCQGEISIGSQTTFANGTFGGSVYTLSSVAVSKPLEITGNITANHAITIYENMEVKGDFVCTSEYVEFEQATLTVGGRFEVCKTEDNYGLRMSHNKDSLVVRGDFKYHGDQTSEMSAGTIWVKGNVNIESGFMTKGNHRFVLNGDGVQSIAMNLRNHFACLEFQNDSEEGISIHSALYYDTLIENHTKITYADNMLIEDRVVDGDFELTEELQLNGKTLVIDGNYVQQQGDLKVQGGNIIITGDLCLSGGTIQLQNGTLSVSGNMIQCENGSLVMQEEQDHVTIHGDYELTAQIDSTELLTNGVMEIKGDFTQSNDETSLNYKPTNNHTLLLSGTGKQMISLEDVEDIENEIRTCIHHLTIHNYSEEGVEFVHTPIVLGQIDAPKGNIQGCIQLVDYSQGAFIGDVYAGSIIWNKDYVEAEADKLQILGDLFVLDDSISLMCNLYVGGEITVINGDIGLSNNQLECVGNLNIKTETGCGYSGLYMYGENNYVVIGGDFVCDVYWSNAWSHQKGTIEVKGNVNLVKNFDCRDKLKLILSGESKQIITINSTSSIPILELRNTSEAGVFSATYFEPGELILNDSKLIYGNGNENAIMGYTLTKDTVISGDCYLMLGTLDLNGYTLTVEGDFIQAFGDVNINGGKLYVYGDYLNEYRTGTVDSGYTGSDGKGKLIMQRPEDYVLVYGHLVWGTIQEHEELLSNGLFELKGDLIFFSKKNIRTSGNHVIKLSGKKTESGELYKQKIAYNTNTYFKKLILTKPLEKGYSFTKKPEEFCGELVYEYEDYTAPTSVTTLNVTDVGMDYVTISYDGATDESKIISYCIFRDGVKIAEVSEKKYTDKQLIPNRNYVYEVYAVDEFQNQAKESLRVNVQTLVDKVKPEQVTGLYIKSLSQTSVTIAWEKATDKVGVTGYNVYRDGELVQDNGNSLSYKDLDAKDGKEHSYEVTAYDLSGNESEKSQLLEAATEEIIMNTMLPEERTEIGGEQIVLTASLLYSVAIHTSSYFFEYRENDSEEWTLIKSGNNFGLSTETNVWGEKKKIAVASCEWDSSSVLSENVEIRFRVVDEDGNSRNIKNQYCLDVNPPQKVTDVEGQCVNGVVCLTWSESKSQDCEYYNVYRTKGEVFDEVNAEIRECKNGTKYYENGLEVGNYYTYCIEAVDKHGLKSELSEMVTVFVDEDKECPVINNMRINSYLNKGAFSVTVSAMDNQVVSCVNFFAREVGTTSWKKVKSDNNVLLKENYFTVAHSIAMPPEKFDEGIYEICAIAVDTNGNESERSNICQVQIDKTGPSSVQNFHAEKIGCNYIQLAWDELEDDIYYYSVELLENGEVINVANTKKSFYKWKNLNANTSYVFRVVAYDQANNKGTVSNIIEVGTTFDDIKPQIEIVGPAIQTYSSQMELMLQAKDNEGLAKAVFSYSVDKENYIQIAEVEAEDETYDKNIDAYKSTYKYQWDISEVPEGEISILYEVYDKEGNHNALVDDKEITVEYTIERTAPNKVEDLKATDNGGSILLTWSETDENCTYSIYRGETGYPNFSLLKTTTAKTFVDRTVVLDKAYMYKVVVTDEAGNVSEASEIVVASCTLDQINPVVEGASIENGSVLPANPSLKFVITDNQMLDKVKVEYMNVEDEVKSYTTICEKSVNDCCYLFDAAWDTAGLESGMYLIKVTAIDYQGNENDLTVYECRLDNVVPQISTLSAKSEEGKVQLEFSINEDEDFSHYEIVRNTLDKDDRRVVESEAFQIIDKNECKYVDETPEMGAIYEYAIRVYDACGNYSESETVLIVMSDEDFTSPTVNLSDYTAKVGEEIQFNGDYSSDNVGVATFKWDMGDGTILYGKNPKHSYQTPGEYTITLMISDYAQNIQVGTRTVLVYGEEAGVCIAEFRDENGFPVENLEIYVEEMNGKIFSTNPNGQLKFYAKEGLYKCIAYKDGFQMQEFSLKVHEYGNTTTDIVMREGSLITGDINYKELSLEEMREAGVDLEDPENFHKGVFSMSGCFADKENCMAHVTIEVGVSVSSGGGSSSGNKPKPRPDNPGQDNPNPEVKKPRITCTKTDEGVTFTYFNSKKASVSWLKEMYQVDLTVCTLLSEPCELQNVTAELELPEGMSLASTNEKQSLKKKLGKMDAVDSAYTSWIVKGDEAGKYEIKADVKGMLMPFKKTISQKIACEQKIETTAGTGLHLYIYPEAKMYRGEEYYIQYVLKNESKKTHYYVTTQFGKYTEAQKKEEVALYFNGEYQKTIVNEGGIAYSAKNVAEAKNTPILCQGDSLTVEEFKPEEVICGTLKQEYGKFDKTDTSHYELIDMWVEEISKTNMNLEITILPIASHLKRSTIYVREFIYPDNRAIFTPSPKKDTTPNGDPISMITGAFFIENCIMNVAGVRAVDFNLHYDSTQCSEKGDLGYGWRHNYESYISDNGNLIELWLDPATKMVFESEDALENKVEGQYYDGVIYLGGYGEDNNQTVTQSSIYIHKSTVSENVVSDNSLFEDTTDEVQVYVNSISQNGTNSESDKSEQDELQKTEDKKVYKPLSSGLAGYELTKTESGYQFVMPNGSEMIFDTNGVLTEERQSNGQSVVIAHTENDITITEPVSGHYIKGSYDENHRIVKLEDNAKNVVNFVYDQQGNMISVTSKTGTTNYYIYDVNHRIIAGKDTDQKLYVANTYDSKGRVLTQDDGNSDTSLIRIKYDDDDSNKTTTVTYTSETGAVSKYVNSYYGYNLSEVDEIGGTTHREYDTAGRLIKYTKSSGEIIEYCYDDKGNITKEISSTGKVSQYQYDELSNLIHQSSNDGTKVDYSYNDKNLMIEMKSHNGLSATYTYNEHGQIVSETIEGQGQQWYTYENGLIKSVTDCNGNTTTLDYDEIGNVISQKDGKGVVTDYELDGNGRVLVESVHMGDETIASTVYSYDAYGNKSSQKDANGNITRYEYDDRGNMIIETRPDGKSIIYEYNLLGQVVKVSYPENVSVESNYDAAGNLTTIINTLKGKTAQEYNASSQLLNTTLPNGGQVTYTYYENGLLHTQTDANGIVTEYTYDVAGRISMVTQGRLQNTYAYDAYGNLSSVTNAMGETVSYIYNELRQIVKMTDARGNSTHYMYDTLGNCIKITDALDHVTTYKYNGANEIVEVTKVGENGNVSQTICYDYDNLGNVIAITDATGNVYQMKYDLVGNLLQIQDAMGTVIANYVYDCMNQVTSVTNAADAITEYEYDSLGNLIKQVNQDTGAVTTYQYVGGQLMNAATDALGGKTSATYNSMGDMLSFTNPNGGTTTYTYDLNQNKLSESIGEDYKITYTYNDINQMASKVNARGQKTIYEYDNAGRIISLTDELGTIEYSYDKSGNVTAITDEIGTITREYDALNRVIMYKDVKGNIIRYSYDEFGNLSKMTYPNGEVISYEYDLNNNLCTVIDNNGKETSYDYDANNRLVKTVRPNGTVETRTYDKAGQLTLILNKKGETVISEYQYSYDLSGNIISITNGAENSGDNNSKNTTSPASATMEYDQNNRLTKYNGQTVVYDKDGNMTYGPLNGKMTSFVYDCRNRLVQAGTAKYEYDAQNHRTAMIKNVGTAEETRTEFVVDSVQELSQMLQSTTYQNGKVIEQQTYVYGNGLISQHAPKVGSELYYHFNNVGSTTAVTDVSGKVKYSYEYSPYGELIEGTYGQVLFLYNGQYGVTSDDNGLYYMRARYYNIAIKRFCNQDILTGEIGESKSLNRYAYVEGNPVSYLDPFGLHKVDTSERHEEIFWLSLSLSFMGMFIEDPFNVFGTASMGVALAAEDVALYEYDVEQAETVEEYANARAGLFIARVNLALSSTPFMPPQIVIVWSVGTYVGGKIGLWIETCFDEGE